MVNWLSDVGTKIRQLDLNITETIKNKITSVTEKITESAKNTLDKIKSLDDNIGKFFKDLLENVGELLDYINPFSENFFLYLAFIPDDEYWDDYSQNFGNLIKNKLGFFYQMVDTLKAFTYAVESNTGTFQGFKMDLSHYGIGQQTIVNGQAIAEYGAKLKFWIGGLMYFFTAMWLVKKISVVIGAGR